MLMRIEVWSDVACPWCWVGKRHLELGLEAFEARDRVEVMWRPFELHPTASAVVAGDASYAQRLAKKYHVSERRAQTMIDHMTERGAAVGLVFRFDRIRPGNTFDAHRLLHLAHESGVATQNALKEKLFEAYFRDGGAMADGDLLRRLAGEVGLTESAADEVLASDRYASEVRQQQQRAAELGVTGVPYYLVDGRFVVSGAQAPETMALVLQQAWDKISREQRATSDGAACGPAGC